MVCPGPVVESRRVNKERNAPRCTRRSGGSPTIRAVTSYVEHEDTGVAVDIAALNAEIVRIVARQQELRTAMDEIVANLQRSER
jgi:hypothetical protein